MRHLAHAELKNAPYSFSQQLHLQSGSLLNDHFWLNLSRPETSVAAPAYSLNGIGNLFRVERNQTTISLLSSLLYLGMHEELLFYIIIS